MTHRNCSRDTEPLSGVVEISIVLDAIVVISMYMTGYIIEKARLFYPRAIDITSSLVEAELPSEAAQTTSRFLFGLAGHATGTRPGTLTQMTRECTGGPENPDECCCTSALPGAPSLLRIGSTPTQVERVSSLILFHPTFADKERVFLRTVVCAYVGEKIRVGNGFLTK